MPRRENMIKRFAGLSIAITLGFVPVGAMADDTPKTLAAEGSSGKYFEEQEASCKAAHEDAVAVAQHECARQEGAASEPVLGECACEQGGFQDAEWLCSAKVTLDCSATETPDAPPVPAPASITPDSAPRIAFDLPDSITQLQMLQADFNRRGLTLPRQGLADRYKTRCESGWTLACDASIWHKDGVSSLNKAAEPLEKACDTGDASACIALGWTHESKAEDAGGSRNEYRAAARGYKSLCDSEKNQYACYEYGAILFNNLGVTADPRLGVRRWETACAASEGAACTALSRIYHNGSKIKADPEKARDFAKQACKAGDPLGCLELARLTEDPAKIDAALSTLCQQGGVEACWELASSYLSGEKTEPAAGTTRGLLDLGCELGHGPSCSSAAIAALADGEETVAARLFRRACSAGDINSCTGLVELILAERTDGSVRADRYAFEVACSRGGNAMACNVLGMALLEGQSLKKDTARARALLKQSCIDKNSPARPCFVLGDLYETGAGGERDRTLAVTYFKWACDQGWGEACDRRGDLLNEGVGVREDDAEALAMYQAGCDAGFPDACYKAAVLLDDGTNITRDAPRALQLYIQGCNKGVGDACLRLGKLYESDKGGQRDDAAAREAFDKAVALGNIEAHRRLSRLLWNGLGGKKDKKRAKALCSAGCQADDPVACRGPSWQTLNN